MGHKKRQHSKNSYEPKRSEPTFWTEVTNANYLNRARGGPRLWINQTHRRNRPYLYGTLLLYYGQCQIWSPRTMAGRLLLKDTDNSSPLLFLEPHVWHYAADNTHVAQTDAANHERWRRSLRDLRVLAVKSKVFPATGLSRPLGIR